MLGHGTGQAARRRVVMDAAGREHVIVAKPRPVVKPAPLAAAERPITDPHEIVARMRLSRGLHPSS